MAKRKVIIFLSFVFLVFVSEIFFYIYLVKKQRPANSINDSTSTKLLTETTEETGVYEKCGLGKNIDIKGFLIKGELVNYDQDKNKVVILCQDQQQEIFLTDKTTFYIGPKVGLSADPITFKKDQLTKERFFQKVNENTQIQINVNYEENTLLANSIVARI